MTAVLVLRWPFRRWNLKWSWTVLAAMSTSPSSDAAVLGRAQRGDARAFAELIRDHEPRLRALAYRLLGDRDLTDDVLQEAYVKAFRALRKFRGESSISTWLYRITYNACLDELRRRRTVVPLAGNPESEMTDRADLGSDPVETAMQRRDLAAALAALPPEHRAAVLLVDADGLDYAEAGKVLGIPAGTVGSRLNRARAALRLALEASG